jgi:O-6-methylguanine DNA methyltransferase
MSAIASEQWLYRLDFTDGSACDEVVNILAKALNLNLSPESNALLDELTEQLQAYFQGNRTEFSIPMDAKGSDFQKQVWDELRKIPYGQILSYEKLALRLGSVRLSRAVGTANGKNPISILIPCHRVIGKNGRLSGYAGGLWRKQSLLELEGNKGIWVI